MFGFGKKKADFDRKIRDVKYKRVLSVLRQLANAEPVTVGGEADYEATYSAMKLKAKLAQDFVNDIDSADKD